MVNQEQDLLDVLKKYAQFFEELSKRLTTGDLRAISASGQEETATLNDQVRDQLRTLRSVETALSHRTVRDPGDFMIDDVMRQAAAIRRSGDEPARVRMSPLDWGKMYRSPNALHMLTVGPPPTVSGIEIVFDGEWDGPVTVEGLSNKPLRPSQGGH